MPARDGKGPFGTGPVGRGLGPCFENEQEPDQQMGMGFGRRRGRRYGGNRRPRWGWRSVAAFRPEEGIMQALQSRRDWLKEQLEALTRAIEERQ